MQGKQPKTCMDDSHSLRDINISGQRAEEPHGKKNVLKTGSINKITAKVSPVFPVCWDPAYMHNVQSHDASFP